MMSELGSFVTQYMYCSACFKALWPVLVTKKKYLTGQPIDHWDGWDREGYLPIIAGEVGGTYGGEETDVFDCGMRDEIERAICHPLRISVLCDVDRWDQVLTFNPLGADRRDDDG